METLFELVSTAFAAIKRFIIKTVQGVLNWAKHIVDWFKVRVLGLSQNAVVFKNEKMRELIDNARKVDVGLRKGVTKCIYDEELNEIVAHEVTNADEIDEQTRAMLGNDGMVVLC